MRLTKILIILMGAVFLSCEETTILDLEQAPAKIVVEGQVTNTPDQQYVRITRTADFYSSGSTGQVTDAAVVVTDDLGNSVPYVHQEMLPGYYLPTMDFVGTVGRTYKLSVVVDGQAYEAVDQMVSVAEYELKSKKNEDPGNGRKESGHIYDLLLFMKEPKETKDYYLFKFYRNDTLVFNDPRDIYFFNDDALGESIEGLEAPVYFGAKDSVRVEMLSLTRNGYIFFSHLTNLLYSDGGMFGPVPANPKGNISNGALGFFQVSAVRPSELIIAEE